jgi:hypothetical protein
MTFREIFGSLTGPVAILIGLSLGGLWSWEQRRKRHATGTAIDTSDPIWTAALEKARASLPRFRELAAPDPSRAFVKYPLHTTSGAIEHVWGGVSQIAENTLTAGLDTPPVDGKPAKSPPYELEMSEIEDWRVEVPDGRIFGAYTARAQIDYARKHGYEVPQHMLAIEKCLVDV